MPCYLLRPIPLFLIEPFAKRSTQHIALKFPEIFDRLGPCTEKIFLINPTNMPFVFLLNPNRTNPWMKTYRHKNGLEYDASISGSFLNLLHMIDAERDGDALFFTRDLKIEGETEAVVYLRNALDDINGNIASEIASLYGATGKVFLSSLRHIGG